MRVPDNVYRSEREPHHLQRVARTAPLLDGDDAAPPQLAMNGSARLARRFAATKTCGK